MENIDLKSDSIGRHCLGNFHNIKNARKFDSEEVMRGVIKNIAEKAKMKIVNESYFKFSPQGLSGAIIISTSHITFHLWPEKSFMSVDIYSCGDEGSPIEAMNELIRILKPDMKESTILNLDRSIYKDKPFGYSLYLDAHGCTPAKKLDSIDVAYDFLNDLLEKIGMSKQSEPNVVRTDGKKYPDKAGLSASVFLVESGIMLHTISTKKSFISLDVYSCKKFDKELVKKLLNKTYHPKVITNEQFFERGTEYMKYSDENPK